MSKPGIDGHWRGGIVVSRAIRDAGMELIFGGFQNVQQIVETAIQEDVDVLGLSIHSGAHFAYTQQVIDLLKERGVLEDIMILVGGVIPAQDFGLPLQYLRNLPHIYCLSKAQDAQNICHCYICIHVHQGQ